MKKQIFVMSNIIFFFMLIKKEKISVMFNIEFWERWIKGLD